MSRILERLGLITETELTFDISKEEFKNMLSRHIDPSNSGNSIFKGDNDYNGGISHHTFYLRQNTGILVDSSHADLDGEILEKENGIKVKVRVSGLKAREWFFLLFGTFALLYGLANLTTGTYNTYTALFLGIAFIGFTHYHTRTAVTKMLDKFERDIAKYLNKHKAR